MEKILLFSVNKKIIENTKRIIEGKYELLCNSYNQLNGKEYQYIDAVIMHFAHNIIKKNLFELIIKVKVKLGTSMPILAIMENESPQDIFSILQLGVYDYIESTDNLLEYQKKIKALILWRWYLKKYENGTKRQ